MPIIPEDSVMEDFVHWDKAEPALGLADTAPPSGTNLDFQPVRENQDFDLALANIDGDDFSFWALEHFETSNFAPANPQGGPLPRAQASDVAAPDLREFSDGPCDACDASGFACKRLEEGKYKGYCTTCVALEHNCSFGLAPSVATATEPFPSNPWPIAGQHASVLREEANTLRGSSSPDLETLATGAESLRDNSPNPPAVPKIGARFSRESVRILKTWLSTHSTRPYPTDEERDTLQRQTGLNKTQISNWLANARRRSKGKFQPMRSTSPSVRGFSGAIEIPGKRATPSAEHMNPLQRWQNSPPESEPASVTAIASAILSNSNSSGLESPNSMSLNYNFTDDDADRSLHILYAQPDDAHVEGHNFTSCQERQLDERTFYRKDHLRQHLKLVHNTKYLNWSMDPWKVATPDIKSRCGFCGLTLGSWGLRVDHLAEHFKTGSDMKDWKGDWGFENAVLSNVENAVPPWFIHQERQSPLPFQASQQSPESPRNAYELIKIELAYYLRNTRDATGVTPSDEEMQHEACRIIYASEPLKHGVQAPEASWLRDLLLSSDELRLRAQLSRLRGPAENCLGRLQINGQQNIFENCPVETQLNDFVKARTLLGLTATEFELQVEACNIVGRMEESSIMPSEDVANFILRLIYKDSAWMSSFRQRAGLPMPKESLNLKGQSAVNSTIYNYSQLEIELAEFTRNQRAMGSSPTDDELRNHARCVVHKCSKTQNETAADNTAWLEAFKQRHVQAEPGQVSPSDSNSPTQTLIPGLSTSSASAAVPSFSPFTGSGTNSPANTNCPESSSLCGMKRSQFFLNGSASYRQIVRELARYVASAMSPNNPNRHIPTDEEIRHQARWVLYDDDDPFNVTPADSVEWLTRFKRTTGILPATDGPGLPDDMGTGVNESGLQTRLQGANSASASPKPIMLAHAPFAMQNASESNIFEADLNNVFSNQNYGNPGLSAPSNPGAVFSSQDFEEKLMQFAVAEVATSGRMPADEALIARAKEILGFEVWQAETTPADDPDLLGRFKVLVVDKVRTVLGDPGESSHGAKNSSPIQTTSSIPSPPTTTHLPERGMDAIDPGLLPDLPPAGADRKKSSASPLPGGDVQVAISEARLDEILRGI
ncbi:hypothetical protein diail_11397 [Diaporthe ilicicola]|nr:hypothetical protein diail_11397 [Diaporthe ilicicola]